MPTKEEVIRLLATLDRNKAKHIAGTRWLYWHNHYAHLHRLAKLAGLIA